MPLHLVGQGVVVGGSCDRGRLPGRIRPLSRPDGPLPQILDRFYQDDKARQRDHPSRGLGLGLSICQAIVATHGGTIEASSTLSQGTAFTVSLSDRTHRGSVDKNSVSSPATSD